MRKGDCCDRVYHGNADRSDSECLQHFPDEENDGWCRESGNFSHPGYGQFCSRPCSVCVWCLCLSNQKTHTEHICSLLKTVTLPLGGSRSFLLVDPRRLWFDNPNAHELYIYISTLISRIQLKSDSPLQQLPHSYCTSALYSRGGSGAAGFCSTHGLLHFSIAQYIFQLFKGFARIYDFSIKV